MQHAHRSTINLFRIHAQFLQQRWLVLHTRERGCAIVSTTEPESTPTTSTTARGTAVRPRTRRTRRLRVRIRLVVWVGGSVEIHELHVLPTLRRRLRNLRHVARDARAFDALDVLSPLESTRTLRARARASSSAVARAVCQSLYSEEISPMSSNRRVTIGRESPRRRGAPG